MQCISSALISRDSVAEGCGTDLLPLLFYHPTLDALCEIKATFLHPVVSSKLCTPSLLWIVPAGSSHHPHDLSIPLSSGLRSLMALLCDSLMARLGQVP